jgi:hypothetical protein
MESTEPHEPTEAKETISQLKARKKKAYKKRRKERELLELQAIPEVKPIHALPEAQANLEKWDEMVGIIEDFKKQYKRLPSIRSGNKMECVIGRWIFLQQSRYKSGHMHSYHVKKLKDVGILR